MKKIAIIAVLCLLLNGCATCMLTYAANGPILYGGTIIDLAILSDDSQKFDTGFTFMAVIDLPLSFALDTILLPITLLRALINLNWSPIKWFPL